MAVMVMYDQDYPDEDDVTTTTTTTTTDRREEVTRTRAIHVYAIFIHPIIFVYVSLSGGRCFWIRVVEDT